MARRLFDKARRDQAGAGAGGGKLARVFWIIEKAEIGGTGAVERRDIADRPLGGVAGAKLGTRQGGNRPGGELAIRYDKIPHVAGVVLKAAIRISCRRRTRKSGCGRRTA
jgi:hypothetical protein